LQDSLLAEAKKAVPLPHLSNFKYGKVGVFKVTKFKNIGRPQQKIGLERSGYWEVFFQVS
jgi:hypothetical protein